MEGGYAKSLLEKSVNYEQLQRRLAEMTEKKETIVCLSSKAMYHREPVPQQLVAAQGSTGKMPLKKWRIFQDDD